MGFSVVIPTSANMTASVAGEAVLAAITGANATLTASVAIPGPQGPQGPQGTPGTPGTPGVGVPAGGTAGQILAKIDGVNYNTHWIDDANTVVWGDIGGSLANQTDLQSALDGKYSTSNPSGFITSAALTPYLTISSAAATYYLQTNPSGFITSAALAGYATESWVTSQGYITSSALTPYLTKADNLGSLTNFATARDNLGLGSLNSPTFAALTIQGSGLNVANLGATFLTLSQPGYGQFTIQPSQGIVFPDATIQTTAYPGPPGATTWGSIGGTLSNQTDLQNALNAKYDASNPSGFLTSSSLAGYATESWVTSQGYITSVGFYPLTQDLGYDTSSNDGRLLIDGVFDPTSSASSARLNFGSTTPSSPLNGDFWSNGTNFRYTLGGTTYNIASESYVTTRGYITSSALSPYLLSSTAAATYQTLAGMSDYAQLSGATFTGNVFAPTPSPGTDSTRIATTEWVKDFDYAPTNSPHFTGNPQSVTPNLSDNDTSIATTAFVKGQSYLTSAALVGYATESWVTSQGYITSSALSPYLLSSTAASTYYLQTNPAGYINTTTLGNGSAPAGEDILDALQNAVAPSTSNPYATEGYTDSSISSLAATLSSTYATIASPSLTGVPLSTTASPGTNTQQIATTAFVTAAVPAFAAVTDVINNPTSTTTSVNPFTLVNGLCNPNVRSLAAMSSTAISGSGQVGSSGPASGYREMYTNAVSSVGRAGFYFGRTDVTPGYNNSNWRLINWSKKVILSGRSMMGSTDYATNYNGDANTVSRIFLGGRAATVTTGDMTQKGISLFKVGGNATAVQLQVHNGTTATTVASSFTPATGEAFSWTLYSDGTGNVTLYINGSSVATSSAGPTGNSTTYYTQYGEQVEATALAAVKQIFYCFGGQLYIET